MSSTFISYFYLSRCLSILLIFSKNQFSFSFIFFYSLFYLNLIFSVFLRASLVAQRLKHLPAMSSFIFFAHFLFLVLFISVQGFIFSFFCFLLLKLSFLIFLKVEALSIDFLFLLF